MKGSLIIGLFIIFVLIVGYLIFFQSNFFKEKLSSEQILEIIKPQIQFYCQDLDDKANSSNCIICGGTYSGELEYMNYLYVTNFSEGQRERYKYMVEDAGSFYNVTSQLPMIAGRNDRPSGYDILTFKIDKKGNLIDSNIPEVSECFE